MSDHVWVMCPTCNEWRRESAVEIEDISEDAFGRDVLVFVCPVCETRQDGFRVVRR